MPRRGTNGQKTAVNGQCTVFDYSESQLESERMVAGREGYSINIVKGDFPILLRNKSADN
jgi:hypothetical protein